ncbi:MAG: hypothetical protein WC791_00880 [Candidatus Paceibacterota bacterium]|jgi:hypothetical protein
MFETLKMKMRTHIEEKPSVTLRAIRVTLLILIIIGLALLATQDKWVPVLVNAILGIR